ncbi:MAG: hypothetical protein HY870_11125 [Chloroflexi bacterium]|nr:hypothetical protein [Chloroflexota bacterium]
MKISNQQSTIRNILWLALPSLLVIAALWFDWLPWLRGNSEWQWPLRGNVDLARAMVPLLALATYVAIGVWWLRVFAHAGVSRKIERVFLLCLTLAAPLIQLALAYGVSRVPLLEFFGPTVSVHTSGYFTTAVANSDLNQLLAHYPAIMPTLPIHAQSHPPGPIVAHWLSWQVFQALGPTTNAIALPLRTLQCHNPGLMVLDNAQIASATLGMVLPLIGGLAVWPLFGFGKRVAGSKAAALSAVLFPITPLFAMWPAQWDQIYPLALLSGWYLAHTGLTARPSTTLRSAQDAPSSSWTRIFLAGVPLSIASFFSVGNFVLMAIVGLYGAVWLALNHRLKSALPVALAFGAGCLSVWLVYAVIYGVNPLDVIATGSRLAFESTTGNRTYGAWLVGNPIDFAVFLGAPIIAVLMVRQVSRRDDKLTSVGSTALLIATFGSLLALVLSGIVRGEVGRLWMYFGPLVALIASWLFTRHSSLVTRHSSLIIALLALQLFVMNTRWLVNDSFLDAPPERSVVSEPPTMSYAIDYAFGDQIALRGYDVHSTDDHIDLRLYWQALTQPPHAYTVFAHVFDANGQAVGQQDNMPVNNQLPTSCWRPGEYVSDPYTIALTDGARGPFTLKVGVYRLETGDRLPLADGAGTSVRLQVP